MCPRRAWWLAWWPTRPANLKGSGKVVALSCCTLHLATISITPEPRPRDTKRAGLPMAGEMHVLCPERIQ